MKIIAAAVILLLLSPLAIEAQDQSQTPTPAAAAPAPTPAAAEPAAPAPVPAAKTDASAPAPSLENQPVDTLPRKYVDLWNTGDFDQMKSFYSPFFMTSHGPRIRVDPGMLQRVITAWRKSMPDLNFKIADIVVEGDKVAMRLTFTGTYKAQLFPYTIPPVEGDPPKTIRGTEMLFFQIKAGKIVEIWEDYDEMVMRTQMGGSWSVPKTPMAPASGPASKPTPPPAPKP